MNLPEPLTSWTSYLAALTMLTLVVGYARALAQRSRGPVFHLVTSICLVFVTYVARTLYWDVFHSDQRDAVQHINLIFDFLAIWGGIHGHVAIYQMIPEEDRSRWTIFTAWLYPPFLVSGPFRRLFRWLF